MRFARHKNELRTVQPTSLRGARRAIAGGQDSRVDPEMVHDVKRLRAEGMSMDKIAAHLDLPKSTVFRWLNPQSEKRRLAKAKQRTMAGRRALNRQVRDATVKAHGGSVAHAYAHVRKALEDLERAIQQEQDDATKRHIQTAMNKLYYAEDEIVKASRGAEVQRVAA